MFTPRGMWYTGANRTGVSKVEKLVAAMSGGVDSAVAAWLLKEQGYDLMGVTLRLYHGAGTDRPCGSADDVEDARAVARQLGIPHSVFDCSDCFLAQVVDPFVRAYEQGRTPNPCIDCNRRIKFDALLRRTRELGREGVATGHYARVSCDAPSGRWLLRTAVHPEKDQSYVLYSLTQDQLAHSLLPLGGLSKEEIRAIALEQGLVNARKRESQDICFVPDGDYAAFIRRRTGRDYPAGDFITPDGRVLGRHEGVIAYTVGQRRGLGVSSASGRLYVTKIDPAANTVTLADNAALFARTLEADGINLIPCRRLDGPVRVQAKVRYRQQAQPATAEQIGPDRLRVTFDQPQRAITPGQAVVLYDGELVLGGGTIDTIGE